VVASSGSSDPSAQSEEDDALHPLPTKEESKTLLRIAGPIPWIAFALCLADLAERASHYAALRSYRNFLSNPLPPGKLLQPLISYSPSLSSGEHLTNLLKVEMEQGLHARMPPERRPKRVLSIKEKDIQLQSYAHTKSLDTLCQSLEGG
jgi:hypothetical protein